MALDGQHNSYSCKCLNVRLHSSPPLAAAIQSGSEDEAYIALYVGNGGVTIVHTQLTVRSKGPRFERNDGGGTQSVRHVSLTCLICKFAVYRVPQVITPDIASSEGSLFPKEDWAESEVLKSVSGWVEVSRECLTGNEISNAEAASSYSKVFSVVIPSDVSISPFGTHAELPEALPSAPGAPEPEAAQSLLPVLPELFPPPPFTPGHTVFTHLSAVAVAESQKLRAAAEEELKKIVEQKVAELKSIEGKVKQEVELLWKKFNVSLEQFEDEDESQPVDARRPSVAGRRRSSGKFPGLTSPTHPNSHGVPASVRINDFVPISTPMVRTSSNAPTTPIVSALSASLATSTFHHPRALAEQNGSKSNGTGTASSPSQSISTDRMSPSTASSRTLGMTLDGEAAIREAHRRNMDQALDIATSFKYVSDLAAQMEARRQQELEEEAQAAADEPSPVIPTAPRGRSPGTSRSAIKKSKEADTASSGSKQSHSPGKDPTTPKNKRKVTFDVKPDVAIITTSETAAQTTAPAKPRVEEEVFDMESEILADEAPPVTSPTSVPPSEETTPVPEPARPPTGRYSRRTSSGSGLPSSFSTLRPASLPAPSHIRPPISFEGLDSRSRLPPIRESEAAHFAEMDTKRPEIVQRSESPEDETPTDSRETEILRLVAASTPSHRSAWKKDSKAWQVFVNREKPRDDERDAVAEESESSNSAAYYDESGDESGAEDEHKDQWENLSGMPASLPIPIGPLGMNKKASGVSSYQPKTSLSDRPRVLVPPLNKASAAAARRASYAERDRMRAHDPGALDFTPEEDEDDIEDDEDSQGNKEVGSKARQRALKILQARDEVPSAGMWRSLA